MTRNSRRLQKAVQAIFNDYREKASCAGQVYQNAACGCDNALQMWRGPKGDKGDTGPQGPKGDNAGSFLVDASFVVDPAGQEPGAYLKLVLIDVAQQEQIVYVNLSELTDIYTGGDGISIVDMVVAAKLGAGLTFDQSGNIASAYQFCDGLDEASNAVTVKLDAGNHILGFAGSGCKGLTATVSLAASATGTSLVLTGADSAVLSTVPLNAGSGIIIRKTDNGFTWLADPSALVSSQSGNQLSVSQSDSKLYVGGNTLNYTFGSGTFTLKDASNNTLSSVTVPSAVRMLEGMELMTDDGVYLHLTYLRDNGLRAYQDVSLDGLFCHDVETDDFSVTAHATDVPSGNWNTASLSTLGGRTVVWNQHNKATYTTSIAGTALNNSVCTVAEGVLTIRATMKGSVFRGSEVYDMVQGHKYFYTFKGKVATVQSEDVIAVTTFYNQTQYIHSSIWETFSGVVNYISPTSGRIYYPVVYDNRENGWDDIQITPVIYIDLTLMFGAGNEPATVAEFEAMFPVIDPAYNAGELRSAGGTEVVSKDTNGATLASLPIPAAIRALPGYGWSAGTAKNWVDFDRKVYVQEVGSVDLGTLNWFYQNTASHERFICEVYNINKVADWATYGNAICDRVPIIVMSQVYNHTLDGIAVDSASNRLQAYIASKMSMTAAEFKASLSGVMLYYELAAPIETDISALLTGNSIEVEPGGTLTFANQHGDDFRLPVPVSGSYVYERPWVFEDCVREVVWKETTPALEELSERIDSLSVELELDAKCEDVVTPGMRTAFPVGCTMSITTAGGGSEDDIAYGYTDGVASSITLEITDPYVDTHAVSFFMGMCTSSNCDGRNYYALENTLLADLIAAGSDGMPLTLTSSSSLSGIDPDTPIFLSCVSNGGGSYTFNIMTGTEETVEKELTLDLVSGENRTDLKPVLEHIGGKIENRSTGNIVFMPALSIDAQTGNILAPGYNLAGEGLRLYDSNGDIVSAVGGDVSSTDYTDLYFDTEVAVLHVATSYIETWDNYPAEYYANITDFSPQSGPVYGVISLAEILAEGGVTLYQWIDTGGPIPTKGSGIMQLQVAEISGSGTAMNLRFSLLGVETKPMLCLEPSCEPCIDMSPLLDDTLDSVEGSFSCDSVIMSEIRFDVYYNGQGYSSIQYVNFGSSLTIGRSNTTSQFYLTAAVTDRSGDHYVYYASGSSTSDTKTFASLSVGAEVVLSPRYTLPDGFPEELTLVVTALPTATTATFEIQDPRTPMPMLTLTSTRHDGDTAEQSIDLSCILDAVPLPDLSGYLPLSGGTMTGNLYFLGAGGRLFGFKLTNDSKNLDIGWDWDSKAGAGMAMRSVADNDAGAFHIWARNASGTTKILIGKPNGTLTWDNHAIITDNVLATTAKNGLMTSTDKAKLDGLSQYPRITKYQVYDNDAPSTAAAGSSVSYDLKTDRATQLVIGAGFGLGYTSVGAPSANPDYTGFNLAVKVSDLAGDGISVNSAGKLSVPAAVSSVSGAIVDVQGIRQQLTRSEVNGSLAYFINGGDGMYSGGKTFGYASNEISISGQEYVSDTIDLGDYPGRSSTTVTTLYTMSLTAKVMECYTTAYSESYHYYFYLTNTAAHDNDQIEITSILPAVGSFVEIPIPYVKKQGQSIVPIEQLPEAGILKCFLHRDDIGIFHFVMQWTSPNDTPDSTVLRLTTTKTDNTTATSDVDLSALLDRIASLEARVAELEGNS